MTVTNTVLEPVSSSISSNQQQQKQALVLQKFIQDRVEQLVASYDYYDDATRRTDKQKAVAGENNELSTMPQQQHHRNNNKCNQGGEESCCVRHFQIPSVAECERLLCNKNNHQVLILSSSLPSQGRVSCNDQQGEGGAGAAEEAITKTINSNDNNNGDALNTTLYFNIRQSDVDEVNQKEKKHISLLNSNTIIEYGVAGLQNGRKTGKQATQIVAEVILPIFLENTNHFDRDNSSPSSCFNNENSHSISTSHFDKFFVDVQRCTAQLIDYDHLVFEDYPIDYDNTSWQDLSLKQQTDAKKEAETLILKLVTLVSSYKKSPTTEHNSVLDELNFWHSRASSLSNLDEKVRRSNIFKSIEQCDSLRPLGVELQRLVEEVSNDKSEARENSKFLSPLERHFRTLSYGSISDISRMLSALEDSLKMIWAVSRYFKRSDRITSMIVRISNQLAQRVSRKLQLKELWSQSNLENVKSSIAECKHMLQSWKELSLLVEDEATSHGAFDEKKWGVSGTYSDSSFSKTDYTIFVCEKIYDIADIIIQFTDFLSPEIIVVTGDENGVKKLREKVLRLMGVLSQIRFDVFDMNNQSAWERFVGGFIEESQCVENEINSFVEKAFHRLRSSESAFLLLELNSSPFIQKKMQERLRDVLERYEKELQVIDNLFERFKDSPLAYKGYPSYSGAIKWAHDLFLRAKLPILKFKSHGDLLSYGFGITVKRRYLTFAKKVDDWKGNYFNRWVTCEGTRVLEALKNVLISRRCEKDGVFLYRSNFPTEFFDIVHETRHFIALDITVSHELYSLSRQENSFHRLFLVIRYLVDVVNNTLGSLSSIESVVLEEHIKRLHDSLKPGMQTLNWTSLRVDSFVSSCYRSLDNFKILLADLRKNSKILMKNVSLLGVSTLVDIGDISSKNYESTKLSEVMDHLHRQMEQCIEFVKDRYASINPIMLEVEMSLFESDTGNSAGLSAFYSFWERKVYSALTSNIFRSAVSLYLIIGSKSLCCLQVLLSGVNVIIESTSDLYRLLSCYIRSVFTASKALVRWISQSCIPSPDQSVQGKNMIEDSFQHTFYQCLCKNNSFVALYISIQKLTHRMMVPLMTSVNSWTNFFEFNRLLDPKRKALMEKLADTDSPLAFFEERVQFYENIVKPSNLPRKPATKFIVGNFQEVEKDAYRLAHVWKQEYLHVLKVTSERELEYVISKLNQLKKMLLCEPDSIDELMELLTYISQISHMGMDVEMIQSKISERYNFLFANDVTTSKPEICASDGIFNQWLDLLNSSKKKDLELEERKTLFQEKALSDIEVFRKTCKEERQKFSNLSNNFTPSVSWSILWRDKVDTLLKEKKSLALAETLFGLRVTSFEDLNWLVQEVGKIESIYALYDEFILFKSTQASNPFIDYSPDYVEKEWLSLFEKKWKQEKDHQVFQMFNEELCSFKAALPLLRYLKSMPLKNRHWIKIQKAVDSAQCIGANITIGWILSLNLNHCEDIIRGVCSEAKQEFDLEKKFHDIRGYWLNTMVNAEFLVDFNSDEPGLVSVDTLISQAEDHMVYIQAMDNENFVELELKSLQYWCKCLDSILEVLNALKTIQRHWAYLRTIFITPYIDDDTGTGAIVTQEHKLFRQLDSDFQLLLHKVKKDSNIIETCSREKQILDLSQSYIDLRNKLPSEPQHWTNLNECLEEDNEDVIARHQYGGEELSYRYDRKSKLILTPISDRCYFLLSHNLSGKTEIVRDLAKVTCEELDYRLLQQLLIVRLCQSERAPSIDIYSAIANHLKSLRVVMSFIDDTSHLGFEFVTREIDDDAVLPLFL